MVPGEICGLALLAIGGPERMREIIGKALQVEESEKGAFVDAIDGVGRVARIGKSENGVGPNEPMRGFSKT